MGRRKRDKQPVSLTSVIFDRIEKERHASHLLSDENMRDIKMPAMCEDERSIGGTPISMQLRSDITILTPEIEAEIVADVMRLCVRREPERAQKRRPPNQTYTGYTRKTKEDRNRAERLRSDIEPLTNELTTEEIVADIVRWCTGRQPERWRTDRQPERAQERRPPNQTYTGYEHQTKDDHRRVERAQERQPPIQTYTGYTRKTKAGRNRAEMYNGENNNNYYYSSSPTTSMYLSNVAENIAECDDHCVGHGGVINDLHRGSASCFRHQKELATEDRQVPTTGLSRSALNQRYLELPKSVEGTRIRLMESDVTGNLSESSNSESEYNTVGKRHFGSRQMLEQMMTARDAVGQLAYSPEAGDYVVNPPVLVTAPNTWGPDYSPEADTYSVEPPPPYTFGCEVVPAIASFGGLETSSEYNEHTEYSRNSCANCCSIS